MAREGSELYSAAKKKRRSPDLTGKERGNPETREEDAKRGKKRPAISRPASERKPSHRHRKVRNVEKALFKVSGGGSEDPSRIGEGWKTGVAYDGKQMRGNNIAFQGARQDY